MNYEERQRRLDRARFEIRALLLIGLMVVLLTGYLSIAARMEMFYGGPLMDWFLMAVPVLSLLAWVWMFATLTTATRAGRAELAIPRPNWARRLERLERLHR